MRRLLAATAAASASALSCSSSGESGGAWSEEIAAAQEDATSEFEMEVLKDGEVTREEYEEAVARFVRCVHDRGSNIEATLGPGRFYSFQYDSEAAVDVCAVGTTALVEPLYVGMTQNPDRGDIFELYASCFVRHEIADAGYSGSEFRRAMEEGNVHDALDTENSMYQDCMANPSTE